MDELTAFDYITKPFIELAKHADFSIGAMRAAYRLMNMKTTELEELGQTWRNVNA